jgi:hypothetical protein
MQASYKEKRLNSNLHIIKKKKAGGFWRFGRRIALVENKESFSIAKI